MRKDQWTAPVAWRANSPIPQICEHLLHESRSNILPRTVLTELIVGSNQSPAQHHQFLLFVGFHLWPYSYITCANTVNRTSHGFGKSLAGKHEGTCYIYVWNLPAGNREHRWSSGRISPCQGGGPGPIPGRCNFFPFFLIPPFFLAPASIPEPRGHTCASIVPNPTFTPTSSPAPHSIHKSPHHLYSPTPKRHRLLPHTDCSSIRRILSLHQARQYSNHTALASPHPPLEHHPHRFRSPHAAPTPEFAFTTTINERS